MCIYSDFVFEYYQVDTCSHLTLLYTWCVSIQCPVLFSNVTDSCICHVLSVFIIRWMTLVLFLLVTEQRKQILILILCHVNYHLVYSWFRSSSFTYTVGSWLTRLGKGTRQMIKWNTVNPKYILYGALIKHHIDYFIFFFYTTDIYLRNNMWCSLIFVECLDCSLQQYKFLWHRHTVHHMNWL